MRPDQLEEPDFSEAGYKDERSWAVYVIDNLQRFVRQLVRDGHKGHRAYETLFNLLLANVYLNEEESDTT